MKTLSVVTTALVLASGGALAQSYPYNGGGSIYDNGRPSQVIIVPRENPPPAPLYQGSQPRNGHWNCRRYGEATICD